MCQEDINQTLSIIRFYIGQWCHCCSNVTDQPAQKCVHKRGRFVILFPRYQDINLQYLPF